MNDLGWAKKLALILFILTIWYAVLIDAPISIQNFVANLSATSHLYEKELVENYQIPWHKIGKDILFVAALTSIFVYSVRSKNLATKNFHKSILWAYSTLIFVIGIIRHGVRNPRINSDLDFDGNYNFKSKELTNVGLR